MAKLDLPKHPLARNVKCPVCSIAFETIPIRRSAAPNENDQIVEQHVCPTGHVYVTEIGKNEMLREW